MTTAAEAHAAMRGLPTADFHAVTGGKRLLVLAPHPDDEVIGCAALIVRALNAGSPPIVAIVTDGSGSHPNSIRFPPPALAELRQDETRRAAAILGLPLCRLHFIGCRDTAAPHDGPEFDTAVAKIAKLAATADCEIILAPWRMDPHCDHLAVHKMAAAVANAAGLRHLSYPVWGWSLPDDVELGPLALTGFRLPVGELAEQKRRALSAHASQSEGIVDDDPSGFQLTPDILARLLQPFEVFLENP